MGQVTAYIPLQSVRSKTIPLAEVKMEGTLSVVKIVKKTLKEFITERYKFRLTNNQVTPLMPINQIVVLDGEKEIKKIQVTQPPDLAAIKRELATINSSSKTKWGVFALILLSATAVAYAKRDLLQSGLAKLTS